MPPIPVKRWLIPSLLVLLVLLVHLSLLQSLAIKLDPDAPKAQANPTFDTRSLPPLPERVTAVVAAQPGQTPPRPPAKPAVRRAPAAAHAVRPAAESTSETRSPDEAAPGEPADTLATPAPEPEPTVPADPTPPAAPAAAAVIEEALQFNADKLSPSRRLIYTLKTNKFPFTLGAALTWRNLGTHYDARLRYSAFGQERVQTSRGQVSSSGLAPERFSDKYRSELAAHFNTAQGTISFSANTPDAPLLPGAQDRLSVLLQLGALLASQPERYVPGTTLTLQTAGPRAADLWLFTVLQTESLELPGGTLQAVKLERKPREPFDQKVEVWLAPQLDYLPARIRVTEANGDSADQLWTASQSAEGPD